MTNKTFVLILGMHRSGTSSLAGSLQGQGVYLGEVSEKNPYNPKGNRENKDIMDLNESVLIFNNGGWDNPPKSIQWTEEQTDKRDQIIANFLESGHSLVGFKDPRTLITLDFWLSGLLNNIDIKFIGSYRHPVSVVKSLMARNKMAADDGFLLWDAYNIRLLEVHRQYNFNLISFDAEPDIYLQTLYKAISELGLSLPSSKNNLFFDETLRHQSLDISIETPYQSAQIYDQLQNIYKAQLQ